jgi:hypothetical protein
MFGMVVAECGVERLDRGKRSLLGGICHDRSVGASLNEGRAGERQGGDGNCEPDGTFHDGCSYAKLVRLTTENCG